MIPLRDESTPLGRKLREAARGAPLERPGQRERAWRSIASPRRAPRVLLALSAAAAVAALAFALWPRPQLVLLESVGPVRVERAQVTVGPQGMAVVSAGPVRAAAAAGTVLRVERGGLRLESGIAAFRTRAQLSQMQAGAMRIEAQGATFVAEVRNGALVVFAEEGTVRVGGAQVPPGSAYGGQIPEAARTLARVVRGESPAAPLAEPAPDDASVEKRAHAEEAAGRYAEAAALYAEVAAHATPRAATALYELGRLQLRSLHDPAQALQALHDYQGRFPHGVLAEEVALTAVEARVLQNDPAASLREIDDFLRRFPASDRAGEVRELRQSLLGR